MRAAPLSRLSSLILPSGCETLRPPENHRGRIASLAQRRITPSAIRRPLSLPQLIVDLKELVRSTGSPGPSSNPCPEFAQKKLVKTGKIGSKSAGSGHFPRLVLSNKNPANPLG